MEHLKDLMAKAVQKHGLQSAVTASVVVTKANNWLSENLSELRGELEATQYKDGILVIEASHSIAAQECQAHAEGLLGSLRADCPNLEIASIRISRSSKK